MDDDLPPGMTFALFERLPDDHSCYRMIGLIASELAHIETMLDWIIWDMADVQPDYGVCLTAQMLGMQPRYQAIVLLAEQSGLSDKLKSEIETHRGRSHDPGERRNRAIHDPWFIDFYTKAPHQLRSMPKKKPVYTYEPMDEKALEADLAVLRKHTDRVIDLWGKISDELRSLRGTRVIKMS